MHFFKKEWRTILPIVWLVVIGRKPHRFSQAFQ